MFTSKTAMTAREVEAAHAKLTALLRERDHWYDGTPQSVDRRLAAIHNAFPVVKRVAQTDPQMMAEAERLSRERKDLLALRDHLLNPPAPQRGIPRLSSVGPITEAGKRFIAIEAAQFVEDNADAIDDPDEMDERAENFAELKNLQMPMMEARSIVAHFRIAVNWHLRNVAAQRRREAAAEHRREASIDDFPDDMLFG